MFCNYIYKTVKIDCLTKKKKEFFFRFTKKGLREREYKKKNREMIYFNI